MTEQELMPIHHNSSLANWQHMQEMMIIYVFFHSSDVMVNINQACALKSFMLKHLIYMLEHSYCQLFVSSCVTLGCHITLMTG